MTAKLWKSKKEEYAFFARLFLELLPGSRTRVLQIYLTAFERNRRLAGLNYRQLGTSQQAMAKLRARAARNR